MPRIVHIAIKVDDLEKATKFYEDVFGFRQTGTGYARGHVSRHLTDGSIDLALMVYDSEDVAEAQLSGPQKLDSIRRALRQARYPQLSTYEQRFQEAARRLRLPPQISLRPPPYFEGQQYQVTLSFGQRQELQQYAQRLLDASGHAALDILLELL